MRLYLSSYRLGDYTDRLLALVDAARRGVVVPNALDHAPAAFRAERVAQEVAALSGLGFTAEALDVADARALRRLGSFSMCWVPGGNVFVLRKALAESGGDQRLRDLLSEDALVYAGYSAGACVLAPSLHGLDAVDDPSVVSDPLFDGLSVLDRPVVPHTSSPGHPESASCDAVAAAYRSRGQEHWALRDGDVLVVERDDVQHLRRQG